MVELIIVIVILGILSVYALMNNGSPAAYSLRSQAETMAADLRHVQTLASTWGKSLQVTIVEGPNGSYSVSCVNNTGVSPCNRSPIINPATGSDYTVTLEKGVDLRGPSIVIDSSGKPSATVVVTTYVFSTAGASKNVNVAPLTGFVTVP